MSWKEFNVKTGLFGLNQRIDIGHGKKWRPVLALPCFTINPAFKGPHEFHGPLFGDA